MFGLAFVSLWPFHTWAPLGYGSAPSPTAMLHAACRRIRLYGLIRIRAAADAAGGAIWCKSRLALSRQHSFLVLGGDAAGGT